MDDLEQSKSSETTEHSPREASNIVPNQPAFARNFQPYTPKNQEMMFYGHPPTQFVNLNGFSPLRSARGAVKITHPETKKEVKLDEIANGSSSRSSPTNGRTHLNVQLQPHHPVIHYDPMNYLGGFSRMEMFPGTTQLNHKYLDMHSHVSTSPISFNKGNQGNGSRRASTGGFSHGKSRIQPEIANRPPPKAAFSGVSSPRANSSAVFAGPGSQNRVEMHQQKQMLSTEYARSDNVGNSAKKRYQRKFLLTFSSQCVELPTDFELVDDLVKDLMLGNRNKMPVSSAPKPDEKAATFGENSSSRVHSGARGRRNKRSDHPDKGAVAPPQSLLHKAEQKYEVRRAMDDEEAKQRQLKAILNKLTPQNFDRLFEQVKEVNIDNSFTLSGLISQIFDKALTEPTFCEMYASFCRNLATVLPDFVEGNQKITFKRLLLNKCQEEFIKSEQRDESSEEDEERIRARRRMLGNIRLIGELYKKRMLTETVLHECINTLLGDNREDPGEEEDIEALCKLMSTVGEIIDHPKAKDQIDSYFESMKRLAKSAKLPSRITFMLKDVIDLRNNRWKHRRKVEGPKKIEELHSDAAQERRARMNELSFSPKVTLFPANNHDPKSSSSTSKPHHNLKPKGVKPAKGTNHGKTATQYVVSKKMSPKSHANGK